MVAMTAVHFSFKSPCLKCLSRTLKRKPSVEVSSPRSSKETGKCLTKSGSACSPLMYLKLQSNKTLTRKIPPKFDVLFWFSQSCYSCKQNHRIAKSTSLISFDLIFLSSQFLATADAFKSEVKSKHSLPFQLCRGFAFFRRTIDLYFIPNVIAREASGNDRTFVR